MSGTRNFVRSPILELYGNFGVRIFFVISGFLITTLLLDEHQKSGRISLRAFYLRRAYRILPAAYAYMVVIIASRWHALSLSNIAVALTYTSSYFHGGHWTLGHLWSLSVEEQFYLLWPLTLVLFFRTRLWIVAALIASGPPLRVAFWLLWGSRALEQPFPVVMDALAMGCALAMLQPQLRRFVSLVRKSWFSLVPLATVMVPSVQIYNHRAYHVVGLTLLHVGIALSIYWAVETHPALLNWRPIVWVGTLSYSLYLWQQPFLNRGSHELWTAFPLNLVLAFLCGAASYYCVEKPFLALRQHRTKQQLCEEKKVVAVVDLTGRLRQGESQPTSAA